MPAQPHIALNDGRSMPQLGLGFWQTPKDGAAAIVQTAVSAGYLSIDTAAVYGNERGVGEGLAAAGAARTVFVTTKLWNDNQGFDSTFVAFDKSLGRLGLDAVDLYLIHWPAPKKRPLSRDLARLHSPARGGQGALHRRLQLCGRAPGAHHRRDRRHAGGEPDRASPPLPAEGPARVSCAPRHRHRVLEPAGSGPAPRRPGHRRHRREARQEPGPGHHPLAPG